jgi:hypothetical protein
MKRPATPWTSEQFVDLLRSQQFSEEQARTTMERWQLEAGDTAEVSRFIRWLVARGCMTENQANELLRDNSILGGLPSAPTVPIAAAPPRQRPESSPVQVLNAVIVAQPAQPRADGGSATKPEFDVELVEPRTHSPPAAPILDAEIFSDVANPPQAARQKVPFDAIAPAERPAAKRAPTVEEASLKPPRDGTNIWLYLLLGALGLLTAEFVGWALAQLVALLL